MECLIFEHFLSYFGKISDRNFEYRAETRLTPAFSVMYTGDIFGRGPHQNVNTMDFSTVELDFQS